MGSLIKEMIFPVIGLGVIVALEAQKMSTDGEPTSQEFVASLVGQPPTADRGAIATADITIDEPPQKTQTAPVAAERQLTPPSFATPARTRWFGSDAAD